MSDVDVGARWGGAGVGIGEYVALGEVASLRTAAPSVSSIGVALLSELPLAVLLLLATRLPHALL